jgi:hypothetical protein
MSTPEQRRWAHHLVSEFRKRRANVVWFNVQRARVADDLDLRIDKPEEISQNDTQWCGYASILYQAALRQPQNYAWFVINLFENGRGSLNFASGQAGVPIEVSEGVRRSPPPTIRDNQGRLTERMPDADYVALAGLRNHFKTAAAAVGEKIPLLNLLKDIHGAGGGELCNALKKLGCQNTYDQSGAFTARDLGYLNAASGHFDKGRIVILFIDSSMIDTTKFNQGRGNHWVALTSSVTYSPDKKNVKFEVFSWGNKYTVDTTAYLVQIRFFGYVVGF